jgi:hypothetical protein
MHLKGALDGTPINDYEHNLHVIWKRSTVSFKIYFKTLSISLMDFKFPYLTNSIGDLDIKISPYYSCKIILYLI